MDVRSYLYQYASQQNIDIDWFTLSEAESISMPFFGTCAIAIDPNKIKSTADETVKLAHELGHCCYGGFYYRKTPLDIKEKHEYRANVWAAHELIPWEELKEAITTGTTEVWELSEYFGVTEDFMRWTIKYYTERKQLSI